MKALIRDCDTVLGTHRTHRLGVLGRGRRRSARFWSYALTALHSVSEQVAASALDSLTAGADPVDPALPILLNELAATATPHVLVLDDYHTRSNPLIHESVEFLVTYLPPALRLVVSGRADPAAAAASDAGAR